MPDVDHDLGELRDLLGIEYLGSPDSDLVGADPTRVGEFCDVYEHATLDNPQKTAVMALIVASLDCFFADGLSNPNLENRVSRLLRRDFNLHKETVRYWSKLEPLRENENLWAVTPFVRNIWQEHSEKV